jgi:hypothetical protein
VNKSFLYVTLLSAGLLINPTKAQDFFGGITGGMNIADMKVIGDGEEQTVNQMNLLGIGGTFGVRLNENFAVQMRSIYLQKGGILSQDESSSPDVNFNMSFIEMDLSLKAIHGDQLRPYLLAGPSIGFLLSSEADFDFLGSNLKADVKSISKKIEYGLGIGAGVEYSLWKGFLFLESRYLLGLNNLNKGGSVDFKLNGVVVETENIDEEDEFKNRGFQIMVGYSIPLGGK